MTKHVFVIAEAGVNHNGSFDRAAEMIRVAKKAGADAIKFQTFKADKLCLKGTEKASYQEAQTGSGDQHEMLKSLELSEQDYFKLVEICQQEGLEFMSTPFDEESADFLISVGMKRIKVPSGEITNHPFLKFLASKNLPLILSTGMADYAEVEAAVKLIKSVREEKGFKEPLAQIVSVLHCTSNYPALFEDLNLRAMKTLAALGLPVGYSDHSDGILIAPITVAMDGTIVEKHFTLDRDLPGPDHKASLMPDELALMIQHIRQIEKSLGDGVKAPRANELPVRALVRKSVTSSSELKKGDILTADKICLMRPGHGIGPDQFEQLLGQKVNRDIPAGVTLTWEDVQHD